MLYVRRRGYCRLETGDFDVGDEPPANPKHSQATELTTYTSQGELAVGDKFSYRKLSQYDFSGFSKPNLD